MAGRKRAYWSAVLISGAFLFIQNIQPVDRWIGQPVSGWLSLGGWGLLTLGLVGLVLAYFVHPSDLQESVAKAGCATASGKNSRAIGGDAGRGGARPGGDGGSAVASGEGSCARGGNGGDG